MSRRGCRNGLARTYSPFFSVLFIPFSLYRLIVFLSPPLLGPSARIRSKRNGFESAAGKESPSSSSIDAYHDGDGDVAGAAVAHVEVQY